jgi:hypothetical protein
MFRRATYPLPLIVASLLCASAAGADDDAGILLHDPQMLWSDGAWRGLSATADGRLVLGLCSHWIDRHALALAFDPETRLFTPLTDVGRACGQRTGIGRPLAQGKIHTPFFEDGARLLFATCQGPVHQKTLALRTPYPGGVFLAWDREKAAAAVLGRAPAGEGIITLAADLQRRQLYGVTFPSGRLLRCDIESREVHDLGPTDSEVHQQDGRADWVESVRCLVVHPRTGAVYGSRKSGEIWRYLPDSGVSTLTPNVRDGIVGNAHDTALSWSMWRMAVLGPKGDHVYAVHRGTTSLFRWHLESGAITPLARLCTDADLGAADSRNASRLAFAMQGDLIVHLAHGPAVAVPARRPARYQAHLITYNTRSAKRTDHGPLTAPGGRRIIHADTLAIMPDGRLFTLAFVELIEPLRLWQVREHGRGHGSYRSVGGAVFEMLLVEIAPSRYR